MPTDIAIDVCPETTIVWLICNPAVALRRTTLVAVARSALLNDATAVPTSSTSVDADTWRALFTIVISAEGVSSTTLDADTENTAAVAFDANPESTTVDVACAYFQKLDVVGGPAALVITN